MVKFRYLVEYGGGLGPGVWDAELIVSADNIHTALFKAKIELDADRQYSDVQIYSISQME